VRLATVEEVRALNQKEIASGASAADVVRGRARAARERQMDVIAKAKDRDVKSGRKRELTEEKVEEIRSLRRVR
jgi:hypothetical protein